MYVIIVANGRIEKTDWLAPYLKRAHMTIAADGGVRHVLEAGYQPDVIVGDMDSLPAEVKERFWPDEVLIIEYPMDKDETDLELALNYAVENFDDDILITGALGGRLDQLLANVLLLADEKLSGRRVEIREENQRAWLVDQRTTIEAKIGDLVSLIPIEKDVHIAETIGLRWSLKDEVLSFGKARGISNVMIEEVAEVVLHSGRLICVHSDGQHIELL